MEKQNLYEVLQNEREAPSTSEPTPKEPIAKDDDNNQSDHKPVKSFFDRISSLPVVKDGLDKAQQYAVSRFALRQAENTLNHVVQLAPEYAVQKADSLGCRSLDILENRLPAIRESTDTIVKTIKENWVPTPITRLYHRMPRSKADVSRLTQANRLLQEAATNISKLNSSLQGLVIFSRSTVRNQVKGSYEQTQAFANAKMLDVSLDLLNRIDAAAGYLKGVKLPANVQSRIDPVIEFATHEYHIVREEASKPDVPPLRKATNIMHLTSDYVLPIMQDTIDAIQEQLRYYTVYANYSGGKVLNDIKTQWKSMGIRT